MVSLLGIVFVVSLSYYVHNQPNQNSNPPSPTPTPIPTAKPTPTSEPTSMPTASVTAVLNATQISSPYSLLVNGTVTNNSPNSAYDVGLHVFAGGLPGPIPLTSYETLIDMTVPIASARYVQSSILGTVKQPLSTLTPYQSVPVEITIIPLYQSHTPTLQGINVTLVWSNAP